MELNNTGNGAGNNDNNTDRTRQDYYHLKVI